MISNLHIKNIGIIDDLSINFNEGFNVLTGETGAGKTLIIDSLKILSGGRFSKEMFRKGEKEACIEACFYIPDFMDSDDNNVVITREFFDTGRSISKVNGKLISATELKTFMSKIIDIHGQHDNQNLLDNSKHIKYLDGFIGDNIKTLKNEYTELYKKYNEIKNILKNNYGDKTERERKLDLLRYQYNEIEIVNLKNGEDDELEQRHNVIINSEKLKDNLNMIDSNINDNALEYISNAIKCLEKIEDYGDVYKTKLNELRSAYYELQETARDFYDLKEDANFDEDERDEIEKRLDQIFSLKRKYGNTIEEILNYKEELKKEIETIENYDKINKELNEELEIVTNKMKDLCKKMNKIRNEFAIELNNKVNSELHDLEMQNASFKVEIIEQEIFNSNGFDKVEFLICTNVGEEYKELSKIASGGEMSRIMLAIKTVLADVDEVPTLIFDEIDTGISGKAAKKVAEKFKIISKKHQTLCITHLANIAAQGSTNYYIYKEVENGKTKTNIKQLNEEETIYEIARISNGEITKIALQNAKELRKAS